MKSQSRMSRRSFFKTGAAAGAVAAGFSAKSLARVPGANERLNIGVIGCGGMAEGHLRALLELSGTDNLEVIGVCDVYETRARNFHDRIVKAGGRSKVITDYRELLALRELDSVLIATPEHWHARQTLDALKAGKHVYCEKPLTHTISEAQAVVAKARETGLKLQVGVQGMSDDSYASAYEAIRSGKLGPVVQAQIDYVRNHPIGRGPWRKEIQADASKPADLNWDEWLGPAPRRPWSAARYYEWRNYRDYSGGIATDLWVHRITRILKACGLGYPSRVAAFGGIYLWPDGRELPDNMEMIAEFPAVEGITPGMTLHVLGTMGNKRPIEHCIRGHAATLLFTKEGWEIVDQESGKVIETHQKTGAENISLHHRNHHAAIRTGAALACPPELGLYGVVSANLANESWFQGKVMTWPT